MVMRDTIKEFFIIKTPDGMGGFTEPLAEQREIKCKKSLTSSPEVLDQYGQHGEEIFTIATFSPLNSNAYYIIDNKKFSVRKQTKTNRIYFTILVEII